MTATFGNGKVLTNTYDAIGRITQRRLGLNSNYDTALTYKPGADGSQTALLATYQNGGDTPYSYEYDANGNITEITQGNVSVTYSYNAANELIRENNGFTNQTVTYTYDSWGNITQKNVYAYTTAADPGTLTQTIPYAYTNSSWGDQLTSYNNQSIVYDAMGNPTSYLGQTLTWRGKQLTGAGTTTYEYDENGLRLNKTVNNVSTDYYYNGSVLMSLVTGNDTLLFSYDASGQVAAVNHNGTYYYYLRNGQGDIVKLIDNSGATVVEYSYDTWGKQLSCTGSLASTLGVLNPFRYRGYVYDEETQWYYLQSRYYNPEVCRFLSADSQIDRNAGIIGYNLYAYCANNPIIFQDDSGHSILDKIIGFFEMMVFGGGGQDFGGPGAGRDDTKYDEYQNVEDQRRSNPSSQNNPAGDGIADKVQSPYQCFVAGTLVLTEDGRKPIEEIQEGDHVYASDPVTGESGYKRFVQTFERETDEIVRLQINGETITTTPGHPFYVPQKGWTKAIELRAGDILVTSNGEYVVLEKVQHEILESPVKVFNFEVEEYHSYYVGSASFVLVHNSCSNQTGSYEIFFESGKNYVGKGNKARMNFSANRISNEFSDPVVGKNWLGATDTEAAFVDEYFRMIERGVNNPNTYNRIWSPGRTYFIRSITKE